jgi:hypothetical protein
MHRRRERGQKIEEVNRWVGGSERMFEPDCDAIFEV